MHANCSLCEKLTRPMAYRWLGERHHIPGIHGANWLGGDLRLVLDGLQLGEEVMLDYRGSVDGAPLIAVHRSIEDTITAQGPDGWLDAPGRTRWSWPANDDAAGRRRRIAFDLLAYLRSHRGSRGLLIVPSLAR